MTTPLKPTYIANVVRRFDHSVEFVFEAWVAPEVASMWLFKSGSNSIEKVTIQPRIGGTYRVIENSNGESIDHQGSVVAFERHRRLVLTMAAPKHFEGRSRIDVQFHSIAAGACQLTLTQTEAGPPQAQEIWEWMLGNLDRVLNGDEAIDPSH